LIALKQIGKNEHFDAENRLDKSVFSERRGADLLIT